MTEKVYKFKVETIQAGQKRKYGDSYYEFIVTNECEIDYAPSIVEKFCKGFLHPPVRFKDSPCHFDSTETLEKIGDRKYRYYQVLPSTH